MDWVPYAYDECKLDGIEPNAVSMGRDMRTRTAAQNRAIELKAIEERLARIGFRVVRAVSATEDGPSRVNWFNPRRAWRDQT